MTNNLSSWNSSDTNIWDYVWNKSFWSINKLLRLLQPCPPLSLSQTYRTRSRRSSHESSDVRQHIGSHSLWLQHRRPHSYTKTCLTSLRLRISHRHKRNRKHPQPLQNGEHICKGKNQRYRLDSLQEGKRKGRKSGINSHPKFSQTDATSSPTKITETALEDDLTVKTSIKKKLRDTVKSLKKSSIYSLIHSSCWR